MRYGDKARERIDQIVAVAERHAERRIIVLSGTAGTGKTTFALAAAQKLTGHPLLVTQIQFHQSYTYEDFVEGLRPSGNGFEPQDGIFLRVNEQARRDPDNRYVLLIEEFTRASIANVLGELMTYFEHRERTFLTPITRTEVQVAPNLVIMATMNPRDRSALEVDEALIRRLRIINCPPDAEQLEEMLRGKLSPDIINDLAKVFTELEEKHGTQRFNSLMPFGHGIFAEVESEEDLVDLWDQQIHYLLYRPLAPDHVWAQEIRELYPVAAIKGGDGAEANR